MARKTENSKAKKTEGQPGFSSKYFAEILIVLFTFLLYSNSLFNKYNMDDELVTNNHRLTSKGISAIPEIFTSPYYADGMGYAYEYRPLVLVSFAIEHSLFGEHPGMGHFINLLLYVLCCVLIYRTLLSVFRNKSPNLILALVLLFAAHPAHTEVVCSIKNRDEILGLLFGFVALNTALKGALRQKPLYFLLSGFCFFLALISKVTFIPFFIIIPLALILFSNVAFLPLMLLTGCYVLASYLVVDLSRFSYKLLLEFSLAGSVVFFYFVFRPLRLSEFFSITKESNTAEPHNGIGAFGGFVNWWNNLIPPRNYFGLHLLPVFILGLLYLFALKLTNVYLLAGVQIVLFLLVVFGKDKIAFAAKLVLYICLTLGVLDIYLNNHAVSKSLLHDTLLVILAYEFFLGNPFLRVPVAILYMLVPVVLVWGQVEFIIANTLLIPVVLATLKWQKGKKPVIFFSAVLVVTLIGTAISAGINPGFNIWRFNFLPVYLLILVGMLYFKRPVQRIGQAYTLLLCLFVAPLFPRDWHAPDNLAVRMNQLDRAGKQLNVNLYNGKTERPLAYIEDPLGKNRSLAIQAGTSLHILFHYLYKVMLPYPMAFYYGYRFIAPENIAAPFPIISLVCYAVLLLLAFYFSFKRNIAGFGIWVYLISIIIYSNWVMPVPGLLAERFLLLASLGWCIVLAQGLAALWKYLQPATLTNLNWQAAPKAVRITFLILLTLYSTITFSRNFDWYDHLTLMQHDIDYVNESAQGNNLLGLNLMKYSITIPPGPEQVALWNKAIQHFKRSLEIYPNTFNVAFDIGRVYSGLNKPDSALAYYKLAQQIMPDHKLPSLNTNIARMFTQLGRPDSANVYFEKYITAKPADFEGYNNLALSYFQSGNIPKSIEVSRRAQQQMPDNYRAPYNIAQAYMATNQRDSALFYLYLAQKLNPTEPNVAQAINRIRR